jgi:hypothetical protein
VDRYHQLEDLRRSLAMLSPSPPNALSRERATELIEGVAGDGGTAEAAPGRGSKLLGEVKS